MRQVYPDTVTALSAQSALNTTSPVYALEAADRIEAAVEWSAGTSAGVVTLEGAKLSNYGGAWQQIDTFTWSAASKIDLRDYDKTFKFVRFRISTAIVGGTINAKIQGFTHR